MKKLVLCLAAFFILVNVAGAGEREFCILKKDTLVFANVSDLIKFIDFMDERDVGREYFDELTGKKLALITNEDLIVYKFDKVTYKSLDLYRVKVKNNCKIRYINAPKEVWINRSLEENEILGWVLGFHLKKIKKSK